MITEIDYPPIFDDWEDIVFRRLYLYFIVQNTNMVKMHQKKILEFMEEKYSQEMDYHKEFGSEVSFTYILFDKEPSSCTCHDINEFKEAFDCSTETELSAGMETLSTLLKKLLKDNANNNIYEWKDTMHDVYFIGDGKDFMEDKKEVLKEINEFYTYLNNHYISFYTPDMEYIGRGDEDDQRTQWFFQIEQPTIDWEGLMQSNLEFIRMAEDRERMKKAQEEKPKTREQLLEEIKEFWSHQPKESLIRFEVRDDHVFIHGYAELENREGYPVGDGIVFFSGKGECHHELYIANALTGNIRQLSTAGGTLLVDDDEIDFEAIEKKCRHGKHNARQKEIKYAGINRWDGFKNGLCAISWMLYPEGIYFADSDGFGGEDSDEEYVYGIMDTTLRFIEPFRPIKDIEMYLSKIRG